MTSSRQHLFWIDSLKAFAILGIILNHFVESFGSFPWFSNPSYSWPDLVTRLSSVFPADGAIVWRIIQFLGWLGDMGPGIFIFVSGFTLTLSNLQKGENKFNIRDFYLRRLIRIFPLYLVIHLIIILLSVLFKAGIGFDSSKVFLSMLGLRFTDKLFFYINPSWWFIWLILQLYLVFPLLFRLLTGKGIKPFIIITLGITLVSRFAGLMNFTWSGHLEYWMTGLFAGTRLSEFAAGMILAKLFYEKRIDPASFNPVLLLLAGVMMYAGGFAASLFYASTLISNTLITLGLTAVFIMLARLIETALPVLIKPLEWTGMVAFPVFLLHQPLMLWAGNGSDGAVMGIIEASVLILAFPAGWYTEKTVNKLILKIPETTDKSASILFGSTIILQLILNIAYFITSNDLIYKADVILFIFNVFFIIFYLFFRTEQVSRSLILPLSSFIIVSVIFVFVLTKNWFTVFWIFLSLILLFHFIISLFSRNIVWNLILSYLLVSASFIIVEYRLSASHPIEVNKWGELPALQKDEMSIYSLIPDKNTHLRYNNYDYHVRTNSMGFNGPEMIPGEKNKNELRIFIIGDAFTMPEGMEYEKAYFWLLQTGLSEKIPDRKISVYNGGVTGYGPNEMYASLLKYIDIIKPDIFINQVFINEFEEINLRGEQRHASIGFRDLTPRERIFSGSQIPQQLKTKVSELLKNQTYKRNAYNKSLIQFYELKSDYYSDGNISRMNDYFKKMSELCRARKCRFFVLYAPGQIEVSAPEMISYYPGHLDLKDTNKYDFMLPLNAYKNLCRSNGIVFLNPLDTLKANPVRPVYFRNSWHWNEEGHKVIAGFLEDIIAGIVDN